MGSVSPLITNYVERDHRATATEIYEELDGPDLRTAEGHLITPLGGCTGGTEIAEHRFTVKFVVLLMCAPYVILGMNFLSENSPTRPSTFTKK